MTMSLEVRGYTEAFDESDYNSLDKTNRDRVNAWLEREHPRRGDIQVTLTSPQQTRSVLLPFRRHDFVNTEGYRNWPFMSVLHWGEVPLGQWTLAVQFNSSEGFVEVSGVSMDLYGTGEEPEAVRRIPAQCHPECRSLRGCSGEGPGNCDACRRYRVAAMLECVSVCPPGTTVTAATDGYYCLESSAADSDNVTNVHDAANINPITASITTQEEETEHLSAKNIRINTVTLAAALGGGLLALILLVVLIALLCVLARVTLRKRPVRYKVFKDSTYSRSDDNNDDRSSSASSVDSMATEPIECATNDDSVNNENNRTMPSIV